MVLDSHTHVWGPPTKEHPWVNGPVVEEFVDGFNVDLVYSARKLLADMDVNGIDEAVVVGYPIYDWTDNWYTVQAIEANERLMGIVLIDPFADGAATTLRNLMSVDGILGFRLAATCPYDKMWREFSSEPSWLLEVIEEVEFWEAVKETDAIVQVLMMGEQIKQAIELVKTYPDLTYVFDHFGYIDMEVPPNEGSFVLFKQLAEYDRVGVKISEVPHLSNEVFPYRDIHNHVHWLLDIFGRERIIWGSDYPNVSDTASYDQTLHWLEFVDEISETDRTWITEKSFKNLVNTS